MEPLSTAAAVSIPINILFPTILSIIFGLVVYIYKKNIDDRISFLEKELPELNIFKERFNNTREASSDLDDRLTKIEEQTSLIHQDIRLIDQSTSSGIAALNNSDTRMDAKIEFLKDKLHEVKEANISFAHRIENLEKEINFLQSITAKE